MEIRETPNARPDEVDEIERWRRELADARRRVERVEASMAQAHRQKRDEENRRRLETERRAREQRPKTNG
jgi:hypothetical protein